MGIPKDNIFRGYSKKQLKAVKEVLRNFYYGSDLKRHDIRKFYTELLRDIKIDLKEAIKSKK